ncbi:MAG: HlyD family efflux transporter periplasmic adaptor subunit [Leptolyngbya sp. Prado105]|jgi:HlyD family secretion protein|nr:HlyD family efflux transporter periplasmic adaptor subunit [Leptolyngbya sp. Prado105]
MQNLSQLPFDSSIEDWSDSTQEVIESLPQGWTRTLMYVMVGFGAIVLPWSMIAEVDEVGTARGRLEPKGKTIRIDTAVSGTVSSLKVKEGQQVKKGQPLLEINSDLIRSQLQQTHAKLNGLQSRLNQLIAIKTQLEIAAETQQQNRQTQALEQQAQIQQTQQRVDAYRTSARFAKNLFLKDQSKAQRFRKFQEMGIIAGIQAEEAERAMIETQQRLQQENANIAQALSEVQKQRTIYDKILQQSDLVMLESNRQRSELKAQIAEVQAEILQSRNQIRSLETQWKQRSIKIPIDGTLFQLPVQNAGAVVQAGQMIAQLAPKNAPLILRTQMESGQSGFLRSGLPVKVKFDAYPFQDYGVIHGYVRWVSPDSKPGANQTQLFDVEIELSQSYIQSGTKKIQLTPGQTATAEVIIRRRHISDFLLDPFKKLQEGGITL